MRFRCFEEVVSGDGDITLVAVHATRLGKLKSWGRRDKYRRADPLHIGKRRVLRRAKRVRRETPQEADPIDKAAWLLWHEARARHPARPVTVWRLEEFE